MENSEISLKNQIPKLQKLAQEHKNMTSSFQVVKNILDETLEKVQTQIKLKNFQEKYVENQNSKRFMHFAINYHLKLFSRIKREKEKIELIWHQLAKNQEETKILLRQTDQILKYRKQSENYFRQRFLSLDKKLKQNKQNRNQHQKQQFFQLLSKKYGYNSERKRVVTEKFYSTQFHEKMKGLLWESRKQIRQLEEKQMIELLSRTMEKLNERKAQEYLNNLKQMVLKSSSNKDSEDSILLSRDM